MRTEMIQSYLRTLSSSFGIVPAIDESELHALYERKDFVGMITFIRRSMRLEIRTKIGFVNSGGPERAPAWVDLPSPMPLFATREFNQTVITVYIRKTFLAHFPVRSISAVIAHEFAHVVLDSQQHPLRREEPAVDLTAMLLGYRDVFRSGCEHTISGCTIEQQHRIGYLSPEEVAYAAAFIDGWE